MEYLTTENVITIVVLVVMLIYFSKLITSGVGENRLFYMIVLMVLGVGLYLWRSGTAADIVEMIMESLKKTKSLPGKSMQ